MKLGDKVLHKESGRIYRIYGLCEPASKMAFFLMPEAKGYHPVWVEKKDADQYGPREGSECRG